MKKQLLCTSAIALGVAAAPAAAQDWNLDWGGFYNTHVAYADNGGNDTTAVGFPGNGLAYNTNDFDGIKIVGNAEIIFSPSVTLDNGMTFGINIQLEGQNFSNIDESYVYVSSDTLGRIEMGGENSAGYKLMVAAPSIGSFAINSGSVSTVAPMRNTFRTAAGSTYTEVGGNNDVQRISYFTPDFNGFTAGVSYAPSALSNASNVPSNNASNRAGSITDIFDIGINYSGSFGETTVAFGARWGTGSRQNTAPGFATFSGSVETWGVGFQIGYNAFTFGASYAENDNGAPGGFVLGTLARSDQEGYDVGMTYDIAGPWAVGLAYFNGTIEQGAFDEEFQAYKLSGSRQIGPGVSMDLYLIQAENNNRNGIATADRESTIVGTSLNLSF